MDIQVVLTENDPELGKRGEVVKVSAGYAQNYLFPNRKAQPATPAAMKQFEQEKARHTKDEAERLASARALADKLKQTVLTIGVAAGEGEKLFGAVTSQHVAEALAAQGVRVERKAVHLEEPIKKLGNYTIEMRLHPEVAVKLQVQVAKK